MTLPWKCPPLRPYQQLGSIIISYHHPPLYPPRNLLILQSSLQLLIMSINHAHIVITLVALSATTKIRGGKQESS
ncbi:unnamed protein product [Onchocerca flexuosa]|uniref:Ovule protein n=1 Tax=Onchocerca flexuosa TaxID=387005 RepID=A0A183I0P8_9BILA|nr:unnamed protein product [Onchocerca flexuosa]